MDQGEALSFPWIWGIRVLCMAIYISPASIHPVFLLLSTRGIGQKLHILILVISNDDFTLWRFSFLIWKAPRCFSGLFYVWSNMLYTKMLSQLRISIKFSKYKVFPSVLEVEGMKQTWRVKISQRNVFKGQTQPFPSNGVTRCMCFAHPMPLEVIFCLISSQLLQCWKWKKILTPNNSTRQFMTALSTIAGHGNRWN